jgi:hypothetical protein
MSAQAPAASPPAAAPSKYLNAKKLSERIMTIVEQPPYVTGGGGTASTDKDSFAQARAQLVLVALQAYPMMVRRFPNLRIWSLLESHSQDGTTGVAGGAAVRARPVEAGQGREGMEVCLAGGAAPVTAEALSAPLSGAGGGAGGGSSAAAAAPVINIRVELPCRSAATGRVLEISDVRKHMWRALLLGEAQKAGLSESELAEGAEALEKQYRAQFFAHAPQDVSHLVLMGVMNVDYVAEYQGLVSRVAQPVEERGTVQRGLTDYHGVIKIEAKSSAVNLWWPVREGAITFAEFQRQREALREANALAKQLEAVEVRQLRAEAAERRLSGGGAAGGSGGSGGAAGGSR